METSTLEKGFRWPSLVLGTFNLAGRAHKSMNEEVEMNNNNTGTFLAGFLVGGVAGAAATLLLAPQSGEETRAQIRQATVELQDKAELTLNEAHAKAEAVAADVKRRAEELQMQSKVILEEGQKQLTQAVEETNKAAVTATAGQETEIAKKPKAIPAAD
jgi:gas vesicle protein